MPNRVCGRVGVRDPIRDHSFDDNADDSCAPNYAHSTEFRPRNSLYTVAAHSWQCGVTDIESLASTDVRT